MRAEAPVGHPEFGKLFPCPTCGDEARTQFLRRLSRLEGELADVTFDHWVDRPGLEKVRGKIRTWVTNMRSWLTLSGPAGTGKTMWLAMLANYYISQNRPTIYTTMAELLDDLRETFDPNHRDKAYSQLFADIMEADVLCLDEIEKFSPSAWAEEKVFQLLENRFRNRGTRLTILATQRDLRSPHSTILEKTRFPGYLESRVRDVSNMLIADFWGVADFRTVEAAPLGIIEPTMDLT